MYMYMYKALNTNFDSVDAHCEQARSAPSIGTMLSIWPASTTYFDLS